MVGAVDRGGLTLLEKTHLLLNSALAADDSETNVGIVPLRLLHYSIQRLLNILSFSDLPRLHVRSPTRIDCIGDIPRADYSILVLDLRLDVLNILRVHILPISVKDVLCGIRIVTKLAFNKCGCQARLRFRERLFRLDIAPAF